jgi:hypothetical protein
VGTGRRAATVGVLVALLGPTGGWTPLNAVFVVFTLIGALVVSAGLLWIKGEAWA